MSEPASNLRWMSLDEWTALDEDQGGELVEGRVQEEEVAGWAHEIVVAWLLGLLQTWARGAGAWVIGSDAKMAVSPSRGRKADLVMHLQGDPRPPRRGAMRSPPSVVIEVISPSPSDARRDRIDKVADYAAFGVRYLWLVDPELRAFEILALGADRQYTRAVGVSAGVIDPVPGCPGLTVDVDAMWAELDRALAEAGEA